MTKEEYYHEKLQRYNHDKDYTHQSEMNALVEAEEMNLFSILKPKISIDGNRYCILYGEDLQSGICGFGDTLMLAIYDFNKSFYKKAII